MYTHECIVSSTPFNPFQTMSTTLDDMFGPLLAPAGEAGPPAEDV